MPDYKITNHALIRMSQRAIRDEDVKLVLTCGTQIASDVWLMKRADVDREIDDLKDQMKWIERMRKLNIMKGADANSDISALKHDIRRFERLRGLKIVIEGGEIITCYWPSAAYLRRARRRGRAG